jgi:hypothetical protein
LRTSSAISQFLKAESTTSNITGYVIRKEVKSLNFRVRFLELSCDGCQGRHGGRFSTVRLCGELLIDFFINCFIGAASSPLEDMELVKFVFRGTAAANVPASFCRSVRKEQLFCLRM